MQEGPGQPNSPCLLCHVAEHEDMSALQLLESQPCEGHWCLGTAVPQPHAQMHSLRWHQKMQPGWQHAGEKQNFNTTSTGQSQGFIQGLNSRNCLNYKMLTQICTPAPHCPCKHSTIIPYIHHQPGRESRRSANHLLPMPFALRARLWHCLSQLMDGFVLQHLHLLPTRLQHTGHHRPRHRFYRH